MARVSIDSGKCKACGDCITICPMELFSKKGGSIFIARPEDCIACRACEVQCSNLAIRVEE